MSEPTRDNPYTGYCLICEDPIHDGRDFCEQEECSEEAVNNFGRCYVCRDHHDHEHCIGVPCQCECPTPDVLKRNAEREAVLAKLSPLERQILGF